MTQPGRFIVVEGIDGAGKSTLVKYLADWLPGSGLMPADRELIVTRAPGSAIDVSQMKEPIAQLLLFAADCAETTRTIIKPGLQAGHWVLSDRWFESSAIAYQVYGQGMDRYHINDIVNIATNRLKPDLTLWLSLNAAAAVKRIKKRKNKASQYENEEFLRRAHIGYEGLYLNNPTWLRLLSYDNLTTTLCVAEVQIKEFWRNHALN